MRDRERRARFGGPWSGASLARDMTVGEIFDCLGGQTEGEIGLTPWRRVHRARLQAAVEFPGLW